MSKKNLITICILCLCSLAFASNSIEIQKNHYETYEKPEIYKQSEITTTEDNITKNIKYDKNIQNSSGTDIIQYEIQNSYNSQSIEIFTKDNQNSKNTQKEPNNKNAEIAQNFFNLGTANEITVKSERTPELSEGTSGIAYTITKEQIHLHHYQSTSEAIGSFTASTLNATGSIGAIQNANVNGMGSGRTLVFINGAPVSTAFDNNFDLNLIPINSVEKIEILTSGAGKNGDAVAAGGIINIITKTPKENAFTLSFENGSFLPAEKGFTALLDSQNIHATYGTQINGHKILISGGALRAQNAYSYKAKDFDINKWTLRENADTWMADFLINAEGAIGDATYSTKNIAMYQHSGVPGGYGKYGANLTKDNYQNNLLLSTANRISFNNINICLSYSYIPVLVYYDAYNNTKDNHFKHALNLSADTVFAISDTFSVTPYAKTTLDIAESSSLDKTHARVYPKLGFYSNIIFDKISIYPMFDIGYVSDIETFLPNASLSADFAILKNITLNTGVTFAHRLPTFSDLYWPFIDYGYGFTYKGNPDLKSEQALSGNVGALYKASFRNNISINAGVNIFTRWIKDQILTSQDFSTMQNLDNALYMGLNTDFGLKINRFEAKAGYMLNKSYNLTENISVSDDIWVPNTRLNTVTGSLSYEFNKLSLYTEIKYLGKYKDSAQSVYDGAFIWNLGLNFKALDNLEVYFKLDNILNSQYQLSYGYPMPGIKARIGGELTI